MNRYKKTVERLIAEKANIRTQLRAVLRNHGVSDETQLHDALSGEGIIDEAHILSIMFDAIDETKHEINFVKSYPSGSTISAELRKGMRVSFDSPWYDKSRALWKQLKETTAKEDTLMLQAKKHWQEAANRMGVFAKAIGMKHLPMSSNWFIDKPKQRGKKRDESPKRTLAKPGRFEKKQ